MNTRLVVYRPTLTDSGVLINNPSSTYPVSASETVIAVDTVDATTVFVANDSLVDNAGVVYGVIKTVDSATAITLYSVSVAIPDNTILYYYPQTPFELDLDKAPNVRINYNWLDIKEPDNKKSNFSQTIKIPFTDSNNQFFENWFDVNLDTLVYNTKTKFKAVILVDSVPQLEGYIQLKSIYLNSRKYEVVVFGDTANFFADIKTAKLREAFVDADGVIDRQLDHLNTLANIKGSWGSGLTTVGSVTDNDVMYPIIDYGHTFAPLCDSMFWNPDYLDPLNNNMGDYTNFQENANYYGLIQSGNLKPAIRIQRLLKIIAAKAGYSITSTFLGLDGDTQDKTTFFGKQFMTLAPQHERVRTKVYNGFLATIGTALTDSSISWDNYSFRFAGLQFNTESYDDNNLFSNEIIYPTAGITPNISASYNPEDVNAIPVGALTIQIDLNLNLPTSITMDSVSTTVNSYTLMVEWENSQYYSPSGIWTTIEVVPSGNDIEYQCIFTIPSAVVVNQNNALSLHIYPSNFLPNMLDSDTFSVTINSGSIQTINNGEGMYNNGGVDAEVVMAENMPDITQADFVKDLCSRYNLVVLSDPNDSTNLIIEPYQDYIALGTIQYWTDKLDVSKEQIVKTTNELQNKELLFTDLESKDYLNKSYTNKYGRVFGSLQQLNRNDFAKGDFKTFSIYAPFIAQGIGHWENNLQGMSPNEQVAIAFYYEIDNNGIKKPITDGKPMLFYYGGTTITLTDLNDQWGNDYDFSIITGIYTTLGATEVLSMDDKFPLCLPYDLDTIGSGITSSTKMLYWEYYKPQFITGFTFNIFGTTVTTHGYYLDYWSQYVNEIYSDEARIMECNLNLNEDDILNFSFKNPVYIKNTLWRVLSVDNYVVGGKETTKVKLLKAITKLNYDCNVIPGTYNVNGTITFINPATGASADVTNACCEDLNENWTFVQTNNTTGVGTCYHNSNTYTSTTEVDGNWTPGGQVVETGGNQMMMMPLLPIQGATTQLTSMSLGQQGQETVVFLECITTGTTAGDLRQKNINDRILMIPPNTMAYVNLELAGTIIGGTTGYVGKVGFFEYYSVLTNTGGKKSYSGVSGGTKDKDVRDNDFPEPTVTITTYDSTTNFLKLSITHSGDNITDWFAKVRLLIRPIGNANSPLQLAEKAIYQNGDGILYQDYGFLLWN